VSYFEFDESPMGDMDDDVALTLARLFASDALWADIEPVGFYICEAFGHAFEGRMLKRPGSDQLLVAGRCAHCNIGAIDDGIR
jgi:hypothetical protein